MNLLIIGLGSMGMRRIRNLLFLGIAPEYIYGFDVNLQRTEAVEKKFNIKTFTNFNQAVKNSHPNVFIISTPPHLHAHYFLYAARQQKHFFCEVGTTLTGYQKLLKLIVLQKKFVAAPSCTFRFYFPIRKIRSLIEEHKIGQVYAFTYHLGQYLPDWHPWENYRQLYTAQKTSSAVREMVVYELQWLPWILNTDVQQIHGLKRKISNLDIKGEDIALGYIQMKNKAVGTIVIDVLSRTPFRTLRIIGSEGTIEWEWQQPQIRLFRVKTGQWEIIPLPQGKKEPGYINTENMYEEEMRAFLGAINHQEKYPYTFTEEYQNIRLIREFRAKE